MGGSRRDADGGAVPVRADIPAAPLIGATELERGRDDADVSRSDAPTVPAKKDPAEKD